MNRGGKAIPQGCGTVCSPDRGSGVSQEGFWEESRDNMLRMEMELRERGFAHVAGLDEAGRGPLAGPVVAAAVILPPGIPFDGLNDSKLLRPKQRQHWFERIQEAAVSFSISSVSELEIDEINILQASKKAMETAVLGLSTCPDFLLVDGIVPLESRIPQRCITKGDRRCLCIAAASVLAKVTRDRLMEEIHSKYPQYNFKQNKGYGTAEHLEALRRFGCCPQHRKSFRGVVRPEDSRKAAGGPGLFK